MYQTFSAGKHKKSNYNHSTHIYVLTHWQQVTHAFSVVACKSKEKHGLLKPTEIPLPERQITLHIPSSCSPKSDLCLAHSIDGTVKSTISSDIAPLHWNLKVKVELFVCELQAEDGIRRRKGVRGNEVCRGDLPRERGRERAVERSKGSPLSSS